MSNPPFSDGGFSVYGVIIKQLRLFSVNRELVRKDMKDTVSEGNRQILLCVFVVPLL